MKTKSVIVFAAVALCVVQAFAETHTVTFRRMNGTVLSRVQVENGGSVAAPALPSESGFTANKWDHADWLGCVTNSFSCWALYENTTAPSQNTGIDSQNIAQRDQPYTLDEYFQIYGNLAWSDEFNEPSINNSFYGARPQQGGVLSKTQNANRILEDGLLKLRCKREDVTTTGWGATTYHFTSGEITTQGKVTYYKGRIEIRAKLNRMRGTWPSFWTMNQSGSYNEIDVFEQLCGSDWIGGTLHVGSGGSIMSSSRGAPEDGVRFRDGFHRIGAICTEKELVWYIDDHIFKRMDITQSPYNATATTAKYLLLCSGVCAGNWLASLGSELKVETEADIPADFDVDDYEIDYVRIYTNTTSGNTVAYDAAPSTAKLSAPVQATAWRGYNMAY
ncbi:MAG: glycoside hydrolase family 16 protein, partial [Kiritimatiellae bacterium]|nr:glycoside hydrolase family 16 protein [Kiritimatiellia bacterium]